MALAGHEAAPALPAETTQATRPPAAEHDPADRLRLLLPAVIYAVPGVEMNLYFDNVVLCPNPANFIFDVTCAKGVQQQDRWTWVPESDDTGSFPFVLDVKDWDNRVIAHAETVVKVSPENAGADQAIKLLIIGDSLTSASVYSQEILNLSAKPGNPEVTLIGTGGPEKGAGPNRHEGYGGWTAESFATRYSDKTWEDNGRRGCSPFVFKNGSEKPHLDFVRYCREVNGGQGPDFVTMLLGCNDTFSATDANIEEKIDRMLRYYDQLIAMIHEVRADTQIGALLLVPPAASQDAFGANYNCGQTRWQYKRNQHRVVERMTAHYGNREEENLFLIPANVNLDCVHNYPQRTTQWNSRNKEKGVRLANGVHPAPSGYLQIGDSIYCWLKARLAAPEQH